MRFVKTAESIFDIPSNFTRVAYLESTGTQYIDTGYKANSTTKIEIKTQGQTWIFGGRTSLAVGDSLGVCFNANLVALQFGSQSINYNQTGIAQQVSECVISQDGAYIKGVLRESFTSETFSCPNNLYLFEINNNGSLGDGLKGKMWYCRIYDNGTLVRDFIPCIDPLGVACMYDLVGKKPYYNQGTGDFTVGRQIIPVEYLEGTGTQCINTGISYFADYEIGIQLRENVSNKALGNGGFNCMQRQNSTSPYWQFTSNGSSWNSTTPITEYHVIRWKDGKIYSDDVLIQEKEKAVGTTDMYLYSIDWNNKYPNVIYFCKLWNPADGTLVRDYIPCKDENDIGFMFDRLSGECYLNSGTGDFTFGGNKYKTKLRLVKDNRLPAGYTQVEYLESSRTQWIDTGINPENANTKQVDIETNFAILTPTSDQYTGIFGAAVPRFGFYARNNNMCFGYYAAFDNVHEIEYGKKYNLKYNVTKSNQSATLDGVNVWTATRGELLQNTYTIGLFCRNYSTPQWRNNARIYDLTIAIDGTLVRNFIPALDPTGTPCMYDLVTKTPFYNQGTGTFSYGKTISMVRFIQDVIPREYAAVNYIASANGYQYINTGYTGNSTTRVIIGASSSLTSSNIPLFGARDTNGYYNSFSIWQNVGSNGMRFDYTDTTANVVYSHTWLTTGVNIIEKNGRYNYVNGVLVNGNTEKTFSCNNPFFLMSINTSGIFMNGFVGSVSFCKIYEGNTLVRNFVPVVRRIDKVAGMWDTITKQFYGNSGTGNFNYG